MHRRISLTRYLVEKQHNDGRIPPELRLLLEVVARAPDVIIGSWCGKHFRPERVSGRPGWSTVPAVVNGRLHEIKSAIILTPGPVAISEGLPLLLDILHIDDR